MDSVMGIYACRIYVRFFQRLAPEFCSLRISRIKQASDSLRVIFGRPNFFGAHGFFFFHPATPDTIYCSDANLHLYGDYFGANVVGFNPGYVLDLGRSQL